MSPRYALEYIVNIEEAYFTCTHQTEQFVIQCFANGKMIVTDKGELHEHDPILVTDLQNYFKRWFTKTLEQGTQWHT